jgi:D-alanyl-D-alanine carboxypeptidase/D-alanyl-D-alanine endopeptidase (penicillin-binding protein 7)
MLKKIVAVLLSSVTAAALAVPLGSQSVLVVEDDTGKVLLEKNSTVQVPIASLTKLMTAMVVLDSRADLEAPISIDKTDVDTLKHSTSRVPVGAELSRRDVLQLALMSSDNRAAASLARTFPGGPAAFKAAVNAKIRALGMSQTVIEEPTGLSPNNRSTATDLVRMASAASAYPDIRRITTDTKDIINIKGRKVEYHNTNRLVGAKGWDVGLSKTGYTEEGPLPDHALQIGRQERHAGTAQCQGQFSPHDGCAEYPPLRGRSRWRTKSDEGRRQRQPQSRQEQQAPPPRGLIRSASNGQQRAQATGALGTLGDGVQQHLLIRRQQSIRVRA